MPKIKSSFKTLGVVLVIAIFVFLWLKNSIITTWSSPETPITYAIDGYDGRSLRMIFLPKNMTIISYTNEDGSEEAVLTEMKGTYGSHLFWRFWKIEGPGKSPSILPGYRIYPSDTKPVLMETKFIKKYINSNNDSFFPKIGHVTYSTFLFKDDAVRFEDMWLQKNETENESIEELLEKLSV